MHTVGIDVAKHHLDVAVRRPDTRHWHTRRVANTPAGIEALLTWLWHTLQGAPRAWRVVLEATGVYHETAAHKLHERGCQVCLANPKRVRDYAKGMGRLTKTDAVDARVLAQYGAHRRPRPWAPPPAEIRTLAELMQRLQTLQKDRRREANRLEKAQARADASPVVLGSLQRGLKTLDAEIRRLQHAIDTHIDHHPRLRRDKALLASIPGIGEIAATHLLRLLHSQTYRSARQAAAHVGLTVRHHRSGDAAYQPPRLTKQGNAQLRAALYMPAITAKQYNPALKAFYEKLIRRGKPKMAALAAVMRKLIHIAFGVLKHQTPFDPALASANA